MKKILLFALILLNIVGYAQTDMKPLKIGDEFPLNLTATTSYFNNTTTGIIYSKTFTNKGSAYIKLHINSFDLNPGDYVIVSSINGEEYIYSEKGKIIGNNKEMISEFWTGTIYSDEITIALYSMGKNNNHYGFNIDTVAYGYSAEKINAIVEKSETGNSQKSICSADNKEDIACYDGTEMGRKAEAVCRLLINGSGLCTGWLLGTDGHVMTNNHCIGSAADANNTDFLFNYQVSTCNGAVDATSDLQATSATFIQTDGTLDFTLVQLPVNPTPTYGYLSLASTIGVVGERIYIPQHPGGRRKEIAVNTDVGGDANGFAMITGAGGGPGVRVTYQCDTEGGSSGSPVLRFNDNLVVGIHNTGGCPNGASGRSDYIITAIGGNMPPNGVDSNNPQAPTVAFTNPSPTANSPEGSACAFTDIIRTVSLGTADIADTTVTFTVNAGGTTATNLVDYELLTSSVSYTAGDTGTRDMIIRVYHDAFVEGDETVQIDLTVNANGGDAVAGINSTLNFTISDDDIIPLTTQNTTIFSDDFESYTDFAISNIGNWTMIDNDGDPTYPSDNTDFTNELYTGSFIVFNPSTTTPASGAGWDAHGGNKGFYCFNSDGAVSGAPLNDDYAITPQMTNGINGEIKFWAQSLTDNYNGGERFQIGVSNTNDGNGITLVTPTAAPGYVIPPTGTWTEYTYTIPASFDNQDIYVAIHVVSADEFVFMLDDITVTADVATTIQTTVNNGTTNDQLNLGGTGTVYTADSASGDFMLDITNNNNFDYGCTTSAVSRAGNGAQAYNGSTAPNLVMDKVFNLSTTSTTNTGDTSITFYFTDAEIQGWLAANSGKTINDIVAYRENGSEVVTLSPTAFGANHKLSGDFTGLDGMFYFGTTESFTRVLIAPKVYLQGAALSPNAGATTIMRDDLRVAGYIPTTSPYDATTCNASVFTVTGSDAIVDWVQVELRDATTNTTVLHSQSALLQRDGDVVSVDGTAAITFTTEANNYYVAISHRNHLSIMSATSIALSGNSTTVDFSNAASQITFGTDAQTTYGMPDGLVGMWAGNVNGNGLINYLGAQSGVPSIESQVFNDPANSFFGGPPVATYGSLGYNVTDVNMDGLTYYLGALSDALFVRDNIFNNPSNSFFGGPPVGTYTFNQQMP